MTERPQSIDEKREILNKLASVGVKEGDVLLEEELPPDAFLDGHDALEEAESYPEEDIDMLVLFADVLGDEEAIEKRRQEWLGPSG